MNSNNRDFSTISPSAKSLLLMKGHTNIPFARETVELIEYPKEFKPDYGRRDMTFWARTLHFESRYWSIDQLLVDLPSKNILELSSGFSFRGLEIVKQKGFYYIDTDLPEVIATKKDFISALPNISFKIEGKLELLPLNALDDKQLHEIVNHFPDGEIVIVNEGLLMYLDINEKKRLCSIIYDILKERGGYWITADIYIKNKNDKLNLKLDNKTTEFFEKHSIENNKFESFDAAETFFRQMGLVIDQEANVERSKLSSMKYFLKSTPLKQVYKMHKVGKIQATWRLKIAPF